MIQKSHSSISFLLGGIWQIDKLCRHSALPDLSHTSRCACNDIPEVRRSHLIIALNYRGKLFLAINLKDSKKTIFINNYNYNVVTVHFHSFP